VDRDGVWQLGFCESFACLEERGIAGKAVALFGTAFLFVQLLDELEKVGVSSRLPKDSWVLETGGYKGRTREIPKDEAASNDRRTAGDFARMIFGEYGMSDIKFARLCGRGWFVSLPPWARAQVISPSTGREAHEGERGLIRVYDLANVWSAMAVQTEDVGVRVGDVFSLGRSRRRSRGRGCSLMSA